MRALVLLASFVIASPCFGQSESLARLVAAGYETASALAAARPAPDVVMAELKRLEQAVLRESKIDPKRPDSKVDVAVAVAKGKLTLDDPLTFRSTRSRAAAADEIRRAIAGQQNVGGKPPSWVLPNYKLIPGLGTKSLENRTGKFLNGQVRVASVLDSEMFVANFDGHSDGPFFAVSGYPGSPPVGQLLDFDGLYLDCHGHFQFQSSLGATALPLVRVLSQQAVEAYIAEKVPAEHRERQAPEPLRKWSDSTGQFTVEARLVSASADEVTLRKDDGSEIKVARTRLSQSDRDWLSDAGH